MLLFWIVWIADHPIHLSHTIKLLFMKIAKSPEGIFILYLGIIERRYYYSVVITNDEYIIFFMGKFHSSKVFKV